MCPAKIMARLPLMPLQVPGDKWGLQLALHCSSVNEEEKLLHKTAQQADLLGNEASFFRKSPSRRGVSVECH